MTVYVKPDGAITSDIAGPEENYLGKGFVRYVVPDPAPAPEPEVAVAQEEAPVAAIEEAPAVAPAPEPKRRMKPGLVY